MKCTIDGCDREAHYKAARLCQMHYFRQWRYGTTDTIRKGKAKPRQENKAGYQLIYSPSHPLVQPNGYVYEHRAVLYEALGEGPLACELCGVALTWATCCVDHIDCDVKNNARSNLRPTCNTCNTHRGIGAPSTWSWTLAVEFEGKVLTPHEWSRDPRVHVTGATIRRRLKEGKTVEQALFGDKVTHNGRKKVCVGPKKPHLPIHFEGRTMTAREWAREPGVTVSDVTIRKRIRAGMPSGRAIYEPASDFMSKRHPQVDERRTAGHSR